MKPVQHPSDILTADEINTIRQHSQQAEQAGELTAQQLELMYNRRWLRVLIPAKAGGLEWQLHDVMQLLEATAWADGSFGWTLNLGAGANMFAAFLPEERAVSIFSDPKICVAGSGAVTGRAVRTGENYRIVGSWKYATGATHAQYFSFNCTLHDSFDDAGDASPKVRSFLLPRSQVVIDKTWNAHGLVATASHDFSIFDAEVPADMSFDLSQPSPFASGPLYRFPFLQLAEVLLCCSMSGMCCHFLDLAANIIEGDMHLRSGIASTMLEKSQETVAFLRKRLYEHSSIVWENCEAGTPIAEATLSHLSVVARDAAVGCRMAVAGVYPFTGMAAVKNGSTINRVWRDIHTASQHTLLRPLS